MRKSVFFGLGVLCLGLPRSAAAGGDNKVYFLGDNNDGFARVVRAGDVDIIEVLDGPTVTAAMQCKEDGYRVSAVGPKSYTPNTTKQVFTWKARKEDVASAKAFGDVCRAGRAAAMLPVTVLGRCHRVKGFRVAGGYDTATRKVAFAIDCQGYGPSEREALMMYWDPTHKDNLAVPASFMWYADALKYHRSYVLGEVLTTHTRYRRPISFAGNYPMRALVANPTTKEEMEARDWSIGKVAGYIEMTAVDGSVPLHSYYHPTRKDYAVSSRADVIEKLINVGFHHVAVEGYIYPPKP